MCMCVFVRVCVCGVVRWVGGCGEVGGRLPCERF